MQKEGYAFVDDLPKLDPIITTEDTEYGWRGLTEHGEIVEVRSSNGHKVTPPDDIVVMREGKAIGRRIIENHGLDIEDYLTHFNRAVALFRNNEIASALVEADASIKAATTLRARFNRALILLSLGRWEQGLEEYSRCEQEGPLQRPLSKEAAACGLKPWQGEDLKGKRILLLHDHGFGDTIMLLRYVPALQDMGADVQMMMPPELTRLAAQIGTVTANSLRVIDADYFCPMLLLMHWLKLTPESVTGAPYLGLNAMLRQRWEHRLVNSEQKRVGLAWSVGVNHDGDYPRSIPLAMFDRTLPRDVDLYSLQVQGGDEAQALGINVFPLEDFADLAALMSQLDEIISVDTAALHLAGAIGHPRVFGLLSHWHSWRWLAPWYDNVKLLTQTTPAHWPSALEQMKE